MVIIIVSVGMLLAFTVHRRMEENRKGLIEQSTMTKMIVLDCVGILLVLVSAMYVGSLVSKVVGTTVYKHDANARSPVGGGGGDHLQPAGSSRGGSGGRVAGQVRVGEAGEE